MVEVNGPCHIEVWGTAYLHFTGGARDMRSYPPFVVRAALIVPLVALIATATRAIGGDPTNVFITCFCSDAVGGNLCVILRQKVGALPSYRLVGQPLGAGIGVHLVCRDTGLEIKGSQSAVSAAYTIYVDSVNEVFVASAVMLVGRQQVGPTAADILSTAARIAEDNAAILHRESGSSHH